MERTLAQTRAAGTLYKVNDIKVPDKETWFLRSLNELIELIICAKIVQFEILLAL